jgi:hypothetical protein
MTFILVTIFRKFDDTNEIDNDDDDNKGLKDFREIIDDVNKKLTFLRVQLFLNLKNNSTRNFNPYTLNI